MADRELFTDPAEIRHVIGANGTFSLHNVAGSIVVTGTEGDEAQVTARSGRGHGEALPLIIRRSEGGLHIEVEQKPSEFFGRAFSRGPGGMEFEVSVPRSARVEINAVSADVEASGLAGEQSYKTVSGDVAIKGHGGRVAITTVSGDVLLGADESVEPSITTTSGDVQLESPWVSALQLRTVSGDSRLDAGFAPGPVHSVESVSGDLNVTTSSGLTIDVKRGLEVATGNGRRLTAGDGAAQLRFRSLSGDVHLEGSHDRPVAAPPRAAVDSLEVLRALERGEIDVDEAARRLEGVPSRG